MSQERTTPEVELEPEAIGTPEGEPAEEPAAEDRPDQPAPAVIAQAEYTRATQLAAAIRKELGLPKGATQAEVLAALTARSAAQSDEADDEDEPEDPRVAAAEARARAAELRVQSAVYGDTFTQNAIELINTIRTSDDLEELFGSLAAFRLDNPAAAAAAAQAAAEPEEDESDEGAADAGAGTSEGERTVTPQRTTPPPGGKRESGVVTAIRGLFAAEAERRQRR